MQHSDLFNLSLTTVDFPTVLTTVKVVLVFLKKSKLDYSNYRPISLLSNIENNTYKTYWKKPEESWHKGV